MGRNTHPARLEAALRDVVERLLGAPSQIDWGSARVHFRTRPVAPHVFVLTLGFSRRSFYRVCADERLSQFLDAHERAFEHFGGHTLEHLYDRPRTVCSGSEGGKG